MSSVSFPSSSSAPRGGARMATTAIATTAMRASTGAVGTILCVSSVSIGPVMVGVIGAAIAVLPP